MSTMVKLPAGVSNWEQLLTYKVNKAGEKTLQLLARLSNVVYILLHDDRHGRDLHEVSGGMGTIYDGEKEMGPDTIPWLQSWIHKYHHLDVAHETVQAAVCHVAEHRMRHPVREYLQGLPKWDKIPRLETWLSKYAGASQSAYTAKAGSWWLQQAAHRGLRPGVKADYTLILEGAQGLGKSQALRALCPQERWFTDNINGFKDKDDRLQMAGHWIAELGELTALGKATQEQIKSVIVQRVDVVRPPYGRATKRFQRMCVFAGTTNDRAHLSDTSGARRFWSITVERAPDVKALERDRDKLWAEAVWRVKDGEQRWPVGGDAEMFAGEAENRRVELPWEGKIEDWLRAWERQNGPDVFTTDILENCLDLPTDRQDQRAMRAVREVMTALGWVPFRTDKARGYRRKKP
jgi:putative DNA primase/helicase